MRRLLLIALFVISGCTSDGVPHPSPANTIMIVESPNATQISSNVDPLANVTSQSREQLAAEIDISKFNDNTIRRLVADDWARFDKYAGRTRDFFGKEWDIDWYLKISPPFPSIWPPQGRRGTTYYVYAEYQELRLSGPALSRSAPWAKVMLNEGEPANKVLLATAIGPVVHGEGSVPINPQQAARKIQIIRDGEAHLSNFVRWTTIPDDAAEVKAIREYYCQWALTNRTADLIKDNHQAFFEWLSCPPRTRIPVLP